MRIKIKLVLNDPNNPPPQYDSTSDDMLTY